MLTLVGLVLVILPMSDAKNLVCSTVKDGKPCASRHFKNVSLGKVLAVGRCQRASPSRTSELVGISWVMQKYSVLTYECLQGGICVPVFRWKVFLYIPLFLLQNIPYFLYTPIYNSRP